MSEENSYDSEAERRVQDILFDAMSVDEREREAFVRGRCGGDERLLERVLADLDEVQRGEAIRTGAAARGGARLSVAEGTEIGNYKIIERIKQGGFATVYSAEHKISKTFAAIKIFDRLAGEAEKDLIWNKEGKSLSKLDHDNIVKFYDLGFYEKDGERLPYVVVELVKGKHLDEHCKSRDPSVREVLELFRSLSEVIEYIHGSEKIFHLDLKPSNIFVTARRPHRIKLIDFGSSKLFRTGLRRLTRNDFLNLLSAKFAAPEQFDKDEETDHQTDIYSLGAILYLLFTERVPFGEGETEKERIRELVTDKKLAPVPPSERVLELDKESKFGLPPRQLGKVLRGDLDFIIMKCLQKRRRDRYATVSELKSDIDNFLKGRPLSARRRPLGYAAGRTLTYLLGFKGGFGGRERWRSPLRRLAAVGAVLASIGLVAYEVNQHLLAHQQPFEPKRIVRPERPMRLLVKDAEGNSVESTKQHLYIHCGGAVCFTMLPVPGGTFKRLKQPGAVRDETAPLPEEAFQQVSVKPFYMGRFEVTNKQWNTIALGEKIEIDLATTNENESLPKSNVSFAQAKEFCERLTRDLNRDHVGKKIIVRLPNEAEWEHACRGGNPTRYGGGNQFDPAFVNAINIPEDENVPKWASTLIQKVGYEPLPVSSFVANPFGLSAMNGNLWEMVSDRWHDDFLNAPVNGSSWDQPDDKGGGGVIRGGAFNRLDTLARCSSRTQTTLNHPGNIQTGFRILLQTDGVDD
jgi:formylglycine-generating enzyme required for sulfatase activity/serine/threonine protein kinase